MSGIFGPDVPSSLSFRSLIAGDIRIIRPMRKVCAWCQADMGGYSRADEISHGMCKTCADAIRSRA